ncbi:MAG: hypothetical protein A6F71_08400 [Cycloclasticus sp. symbiont of Poecilosclerida sp. M]|nr:MAG: hypothetical protein A6F71_08400 [Cycloclasticus sp. symbiont of Poecilosclerida sp. M]
MSEALSIKTTLQNASAQLEKAGCTDSSELDAEVLLTHALNKERSYLRAWGEKTLTEEQQNDFHSLLSERLQGTPVAYITGKREFWSRAFYVTPNVLIPRPDTELLIEIVLQKLWLNSPCKILDLGTGSGIIAITLALELDHAEITATDISSDALKVAQKNTAFHSPKNLEFIQSAWFESINETGFNLIISNPPYIDEADSHLSEGDVRFEPRMALVSTDNGLSDIEAISIKAQPFLANNGYLLFEHGYQQGNAVKTLLELNGYCQIKQFNDLQGYTRATLAQYKHA